MQGQPVVAALGGSGVGQDHHGRLEALGAVHGHQANHPLVARQRALDRDVLGRQPAGEAQQAGHLRPLVGQRLVQHRVDPLSGLWPEALQQAAAAVMANEDAFDQIVGAQEIGVVAQVLQHRQRRPAPRAQGLPQATGTTLRQRVQLGLAPAQKRRAQGRGQRQVVVAAGHEAQQRGEVAHGEVGGDTEDIGARERQAAGLQRCRQRRIQARATLHEDQDIAGADRAARLRGADRRGLGDHRLDPGDDAGGERDGVMGLRRAVHRAWPWRGLGPLGGGHGRPQVDTSGHVGLVGQMRWRIAEAVAGGAAKHPIHEGQDRRRGAERILQLAREKAAAGGADLVAEMRLHAVEPVGIGTLEAVDRLLLVADHEDGASHVGASAGAAGELGGQLPDDLPLRRRGVLRLVDKDVVDAAVEPEQHPLRHRSVGEQVSRAVDQVVEIKPAAARLGRRQPRQERAGEGVQRLGPAARRQGRCAAGAPPRCARTAR